MNTPFDLEKGYRLNILAGQTDSGDPDRWVGAFRLEQGQLVRETRVVMKDIWAIDQEKTAALYPNLTEADLRKIFEALGWKG